MSASLHELHLPSVYGVFTIFISLFSSLKKLFWLRLTKISSTLFDSTKNSVSDLHGCMFSFPGTTPWLQRLDHEKNISVIDSDSNKQRHHDELVMLFGEGSPFIHVGTHQDCQRWKFSNTSLRSSVFYHTHRRLLIEH